MITFIKTNVSYQTLSEWVMSKILLVDDNEMSRDRVFSQ